MENQTETNFRDRAGRAINDLVLAELFLVQATIESASALGDGLSELREQLAGRGDDAADGDDISAVLMRTRAQVMEPYSTRFKFFRDMVRDQDAA